LDKALQDARTALNNNIKKFEKNTTLLIKSEADELQNVIQQFNDSLNNTHGLVVKSPKFVDAPVDYVGIERQIKDFDDRVRKVFADADKRVKEVERKLQEEKKKQQEEQAKAAATQNTQNNGNSTSGDSNMQVD
jgi:hemerythrin-like domain-containing protein